jgi:triosephosphate isomerase
MIIAGNWKMNMDRASASALVEALSAEMQPLTAHLEMIVFPPAVLIDTAVNAATNTLSVGGQDCHFKANGAHTGDISAVMLTDAGCHWVLVGHSERRSDHGETNAMVAAKAEAALAAGLKVMICVGETLEERESGQAKDVIAAQVLGSLPQDLPSNRFALAYEPVWAIGTGKVASPQDVDDMHNHLREILVQSNPDFEKVDILYGGSVKPDNAADLLALPNVGGVLVGGASLKVEDFMAIAGSAPKS